MPCYRSILDCGLILAYAAFLGPKYVPGQLSRRNLDRRHRTILLDSCRSAARPCMIHPPDSLHFNSFPMEVSMKGRLCITSFVVGMWACQLGLAQVPAGAPAGTTGQCKDGSYTNVSSKKGACRGHQGIKEWYTPSTASPASSSQPAAPAPAANPAPAAAPAQASTPTHSAKTTSSASTGTPAPGGGPGMVWVNTPSNVYHCPGTKYYGTTKSGKYMTEAQAKAAGAHPDHGKGCGQ
jgi:hypothetical protein